uniref:A-kinase anchor protein 12-like isoform X2 n=1 Tax=Pristiophorus japonicus TaxID=55135 RepID=UPI00398EFE92
MPGAIAATVGQDEVPNIPLEEELEEMELDQKETTAETKDEEQKDAQDNGNPSAEIGEQPEEAQAGEVGFKKVFKFVGFKFTMKKEKPVKSEPVQLLTMKKDEDGVAGEADGDTKQEVEGSKNGEASPVSDEAEGSPPEVLSPGKVEECTSQAGSRSATEEPLVPVESAVSPVESPAVDSPLKRFFKQGFFSGLRRKQSFKKAKGEPLEEESGEQVSATGDGNNGKLDHAATAPPSTTALAFASQDAAEILDPQTVQGNGERDDDFEDLTAELANVKEAREALTVDEGKKVLKNGIPSEQDKARGPALKTGQASQLTMRVEQSALSEGQAQPESTEAPTEPQAERTEVAQEQSLVKAPELIMGEAELLSSQEKAKLQGSPLKKLFTGSSIKRLSGKKTKGKKGETKLGDADDARMQSSTESEGSPEGQKSESPLTSPEEMFETIPAEMLETEMEGINGAADGEKRKESITAWASFKKLVTPKKRPKILSESDKEDEQTDKAKSATISSTESAASVEKQEEPKSNAEEQKLERSIEDPKKKVDASVSWEALICVGSSKKRARKLSDSELQKPNEEVQKPMEENDPAQDHVEELKTSSPQDTDQEQGGTSPECVESPVEGEASDGAVSTWESFKRLVTPRRKSKLEERADEPVTSTEAVVPETEPAKEESWVSLRKLMPGRRKKKSDAKPEQFLAECTGRETKWSEFGMNKSDEESDTPAVVPLSEYDAVEEERMNKDQQITIGTNAVHKADQVMDGGLTKSEAPPQIGELSAQQTCTVERGPLEAIKSSVDERSPSWISAAVSDVIEKGAEDEKVGIAEETVAANELAMEQMVLSDTTASAEVTSEMCPDEIAEEAQEIISEVVTALEYPTEESFTEETTEMVSAVSQLTETPVTTAEGTPIREDEALVTRQTQDVLQEAAEKVKLSTSPIVSFREMVPAPEIQSSGCERDPEVSMEKTQREVVKGSCETEMPDSAWKREGEKSDATSKASEVVGGTIHVAPVESDVWQELGEMIEKTTTEMQEVAVLHRIETKITPPMESAASTCPVATGEVVQVMEVDAAHVGKLGIPREEKVEEPVGMMHKTDVEIVAEEIVKAEIVRKVETGMSEAMVGTEKVEVVHEETLEARQVEDLEKPEATSEAIRASCTKKVRTECEETTEATPAEVAEQMGAEQVAERRETTDVIPKEIAEKVEAIFEQMDEAIPEVTHEVDDVFEENAQEIVEEVVAEKAASVEKVEVVCEQSVQIIPAKVEVNVTEVACNEEIVQIAPIVKVTQVVSSEEVIKITPVEGVTEDLCSEETKPITPAVEVTEVTCSEEIKHITPEVELMEAVCTQETINVSPVVEVMEAACSEETIKVTPAVEVMVAVHSDETIKISPAVEVTEAVCIEEIIEVTPAVEVMEAACSEETIDITPAVEMMEAACSEETIDITPAVEMMEAACSEETIDITPAVEMMEAVCSDETIDVSLAVEVLEAVRSDETIKVTPEVQVMEAVLSEETNISPVAMGVEESRCVHEVKNDLEITMQKKIERIDAQKLATDDDKISLEQFTAVKIVQPMETEIVDAVCDDKLEVMQPAQLEGIKEETQIDLRQETDAAEIQKTETKVNQPITKEKMDPMVAILLKDQFEEDVQKLAIGNDKISQEQFTAVKIVQHIVLQYIEPKELVETVAENMETERSETVCEEVTKALTQTDEQRTMGEVVETLIPATEIIEQGPSIEDVKGFEISPGKQVEKTEVTKTAETEVESATKRVETKITCVANEPQSTVTEDVKGTHEGTSLEQATEVVKLVEKVGCKLATVEKHKSAPDEVEFIKASHKDGELVQDDQLDATDKDGQDVAVPKPFKDTERPDGAQEDDVKLSNRPTDKPFIKLESPGELVSTKTSVEECKEESKLKVAPESKCLPLESEHEVKLHHAYTCEELQTVQNETVTPIVDLSTAESSESHEVVFLVTTAAVEAQVIAETVASDVAEIPELRAIDEVLQPAELDSSNIQEPVVETATAIVEAAIEAATSCLQGAPDMQNQQSSRAEQLEGGLAEHKIKEIVKQKLESLEIETEVKVGQTRTFEQQSMMVAQGLIHDVMLTEKMEGQVHIVPSQQEQADDKMHKENEVKIPGLQKLTATAGRGDEVTDQRVQTPGSQDTLAIAQEVLTQPIVMVFETTVQVPVETEAVATVEIEGQRVSLSDRNSEEAAKLPDRSKVTKAECCQSLEKPEKTHSPVELTKRKGQLVKTQPLAEEQTSLQDVKARMISSTEERLEQGPANEKMEDVVMETIVHKDDKETDQNQTIGTVEKQESQEMDTGHQMGQSSTLECAKGTAEKTPS